MGGYFNSGDCYFESSGHHFIVDDLLLDFPSDDSPLPDAFTSLSSSTSNSSAGDPNLSGHLTYSLSDSHFSSSDDLCVPYDELAELEWLSSLTEESFSSDDLHNLQLISAGNKPPASATSSSVTTQQKTVSNNKLSSPIFRNDVLVPGKVRSKRSRAAPCDWSSRLSLLKPESTVVNANSSVKFNGPKTGKRTEGLGLGLEQEGKVRRCLHCGSDKTPQWRRGPMGPKTLCNACGVRFKSGRLVPEYRPAASPTFVPAKHSNSHRKVMELRRQMELRQQQMMSQGFDGCNGGGEDYLIHRQIGPNFMRMI